METLAPSSPLWALTPLLKEPLVVVDIGARWGFSSMWEELGDQCIRIGFEPDAAEYERLVKLHAGRSNLRFAPHALGAKKGLATLCIGGGMGIAAVFERV